MSPDPAVPKLFQDKPRFSTPSNFRAKGWTETLAGYLYEADKLSRCIRRNRSYMEADYAWKITINVRAVLAAKDAGELWTKACRVLNRHGVVALWVREPTKRNTIHYHLIVKNNLSQRALEQAVEAAMPSRDTVPYHKQVKRIISQWHWARYITKAKTRGWVAGREVKDKYAKKRLLFRPHLRLRKVGTIGSFWERSKATLWQEIVEIEKKIAEGLENDQVLAVVDHVYQLCGEAISRNRIARSMGYSANSESVRLWIDSLFDVSSGY